MILIVFFHDVDNLGACKRRVEEEGGEPLLHDFDFQLGHLLNVRGLLITAAILLSSLTVSLQRTGFLSLMLFGINIW